jgi:hypothetical protein
MPIPTNVVCRRCGSPAMLTITYSATHNSATYAPRDTPNHAQACQLNHRSTSGLSLSRPGSAIMGVSCPPPNAWSSQVRSTAYPQLARLDIDEVPSASDHDISGIRGPRFKAIHRVDIYPPLPHRSICSDHVFYTPRAPLAGRYATRFAVILSTLWAVYIAVSQTIAPDSLLADSRVGVIWTNFWLRNLLGSRHKPYNPA